MFELILKGGAAVLPEGLQEVDIAVRKGKITGLLGRGQGVMAQQEVDVSGLLILPGVVDPHVHMRDPGKTDQEDFETGTRAAVIGGVTTVLEHPNTIPTVASVDDLQNKITTLQSKSFIDFGLYGAGGAENLVNITLLAQAGVVGFKIFLQNPPQGREEEFRDLCIADDGALYNLMQKIAETSLPLVIHSENSYIINQIQNRMVTAGDIKGDAHARSRPVVAEQEAVFRVCLLARATGCRVHIPHVSSGSAAIAGLQARKMGVRVTIETCPQYLFFTEEDLNRVGPYAKIDPPLRSRHEQDLLWRCLQDGTIDCLGSDHAPHDVKLKEKGWMNIFAAPSGVPGVELLLSMVLTAVNQGRLSLPLACKLLARNPAVIFGLSPKKGEIRIGADADLVVVDPRHSWVIDSTKLNTKSKNTAQLFDGFKAVGRPVMTIICGMVVAREGEVLVPPGGGQWLRPDLNTNGVLSVY